MWWRAVPVGALVVVVLVVLAVIASKPHYTPSPVTGTDQPAIVSTEERVRQGKELYEAMCMTCHGRNGDAFPVTREALITQGGDVIFARDFTGKTHMQGKVVFKYTWGGFGGEFATDEELKYIIRHGLYGTPMPGFESLSDEELDALVAYIKQFSDRWKEFKPYEIPQVQVPDDLLSEERIQRGRELFKQKCIACHGDQEAGQDPLPQPAMWKVPGTDSAYMITARDFRTEPLRFPEPENIFRTIKVGIGGTTMNPAAWQELSDTAIWDLVSYILYLRNNTKPQI